MTLQEQISTSRLNIGAEVNTIDDDHNDEDGQESCDYKSDGQESCDYNSDGEKHL